MALCGRGSVCPQDTCQCGVQRLDNGEEERGGEDGVGAGRPEDGRCRAFGDGQRCREGPRQAAQVIEQGRGRHGLWDEPVVGQCVGDEVGHGVPPPVYPAFACTGTCGQDISVETAEPTFGEQQQGVVLQPLGQVHIAGAPKASRRLLPGAQVRWCGLGHGRYPGGWSEPTAPVSSLVEVQLWINSSCSSSVIEPPAGPLR